MIGWIDCTYDEYNEISNPEFVNAPDNSFWWVNRAGSLDAIEIKSKIWGYPSRIARVWHPDEVVK